MPRRDIEKDLRQVAESLVLADMTFRKGKIADAEPMYERSLAMLIRTYAEAHPDVDACLMRLGDIYFAREKYAQSLSTYSRLHGVRCRTLGPHHLDTLSLSFKVAKAQEKLERIEDAEKTYQEAIGLGEQWMQPGHPLVGSMMESYAILLRKSINDPQRATEVEQRAKEYRKKYTGPKDASSKSNKHVSLAQTGIPASSATPAGSVDAAEMEPGSVRVRDETLYEPEFEDGRPTSRNFLLTAFIVLTVLVVPVFIGWTISKGKSKSSVIQAPTQPSSLGATTVPVNTSSPTVQEALPVRSEPSVAQQEPRPAAPGKSEGSVSSEPSPRSSQTDFSTNSRHPSVEPTSETHLLSKSPLRHVTDKTATRRKPRTGSAGHVPVHGVWSDIYRTREKYTH